jgi:hypothetical protein
MLLQSKKQLLNAKSELTAPSEWVPAMQQKKNTPTKMPKAKNYHHKNYLQPTTRENEPYPKKTIIFGEQLQ